MQSKSKYLHLNGTNVKQVNENGSPKNGEFFAEDKKEKENKKSNDDDFGYGR